MSGRQVSTSGADTNKADKTGYVTHKTACASLLQIGWTAHLCRVALADCDVQGVPQHTARQRLNLQQGQAQVARGAHSSQHGTPAQSTQHARCTQAVSCGRHAVGPCIGTGRCGNSAATCQTGHHHCLMKLLEAFRLLHEAFTNHISTTRAHRIRQCGAEEGASDVGVAGGRQQRINLLGRQADTYPNKRQGSHRGECMPAPLQPGPSL